MEAQMPNTNAQIMTVAEPVRDGVDSLINPLDRAQYRHAAEAIQSESFKNERLLREDMMARSMGQHTVLALRREQNALAQFRRGPGQKSSMLGLEISMGIHDKIDYSDYMGGPSRSTTSIDYHAAMEKRMDAMNM